MVTASEVRHTHETMLEVAGRLVEEVQDVPPGVVLRAYWRAVRLVRNAGCPLPALPDEAELLARHLLVRRGVRVPHPRLGERVG
jgi:hypothetical protein